MLDYYKDTGADKRDANDTMEGVANKVQRILEELGVDNNQDQIRNSSDAEGLHNS